MDFECGICKEVFSYPDEIILLDCNGDNALPEEHGGSGDIYGRVCTTCYEEHGVEIVNNIMKYGVMQK